MSAAEARRRCPDLIVVEPRMRAYSEASKAMFAVFDDASPVVEPLSIDEAFLDVRGMERIAGSPADVAARLRREVRARVGLPITVGVARTKFLAKVASGVAKPDGLLVVEPDHELAFLHPLAVERLWGVGPATARKLHAMKLSTVGDVAALSEETLVALLGSGSGRHLYALARNHDRRRVQAGRRRSSIGAQRALGRSSTSPEVLDATLVGLVDRVTRRMRAAGRVGRTVVLRLRFGDYTRATRSHTLPRSTARTHRDSRHDPRSLRIGAARDRAAGPDARRHLGCEPRERCGCPARAAVRRRRAGRDRLGGRRRARPFWRDGDYAGRARRPQQRLRDAAPAGLAERLKPLPAPRSFRCSPPPSSPRMWRHGVAKWGIVV